MKEKTMSKYIKLDIEKLYEKFKDNPYNCVFMGDPPCSDCPFDIGYDCQMADWLENLPTITIPKIINGVVLKDCDKVIKQFLEEHECDELWDAVRALRDFYDWVTEEERVEE